MNFNWNNICSNLNNKCIYINDRIICFKFLHEILPTKKRLAQIGFRDNSNCDVFNIKDSNIHITYFSSKIHRSLSFIKKVILYSCGFQTENFIRLLFLDIPITNKKTKNTLCVLISSYMACPR